LFVFLDKWDIATVRAARQPLPTSLHLTILFDNSANLFGCMLDFVQIIPVHSAALSI
jgi:hypothetical protein